jgi:hypothetical protein
MEDKPFPCTWEILSIPFIHINSMVINILWEVISFLREPSLATGGFVQQWLKRQYGLCAHTEFYDISN